ncbi:hypothetical protein Tco_0937556 [Tanacetum coccineum]|uniref:Tf2-1-like SH3-like domain-containing protein n=1 Tax=Tanacetum coccineum TaxID=301880 RepID=A0ABQ5DEK8_9ASTR
MDWLSKRKFVIVCHEKVVRIPLEGDEILQVHGERTQGVVKTLMNTKIVKTLTSLTERNQKYEWGAEREEAFQTLKNDLYVKDKILATPIETSKVENAPAKMLRDLDQQMEKRADDGKANVVTDALSRKERVKPRRVRAITMTIQYGEWNSGDDQLRLRWMIYLIVLAEAAESVRDTIGFEYCLASLSGWTKSPVLWAEIRESSLIGPELVQETIDKVVLIKEKLKAARDRQKSYADNRRKPLEFEVGDRVMLKVSPWKGVIRFGKKGKLAPRYVGPFEILERIGPVAYRLRLPEELKPVENSDHEVKRLKCSRMVVVKAKLLAVRYLVKVSWNSKGNFELTWVWEDYLKDKYPRLIVWLVKPLVLTYESVVMYGLCVYMHYVDERDRLIRIGLVMDLVKFPSFTFGGKEMTFVGLAFLR